MRALVSVMKKLEQMGDTLYARIEKGVQLAWFLSDFATRCGNAAAQLWRSDRAYISYLGSEVSGPFGGSPRR